MRTAIARTGLAKPNVIGPALVGLWLLVPAAQYLGTLQRTSLMLTGQAMIPSLALMDLTPAYVVLLAATIAYGLLTRSAPETPGR